VSSILDEILIEQYTIASKTIEESAEYGLMASIEINAKLFSIKPIELALTVKEVLAYEIKERDSLKGRN